MLAMAALTGSNRKEALKADHNCSLKSTSPRQEDQTRLSSVVSDSPRFLRHLLTNSVQNADSPTSMLDTRHIFGRTRPSVFDKKAINSPQQSIASKQTWENPEYSAIGLAIITSVDKDPIDSPIKITARTSVFGSHLKIQIPPVSPTTPQSDTECSRSPFDFGTKTRNSAFFSSSSSFCKRDTPRVLIRQLSANEMELSEDYTCVTSHGPNPKTTHIFDNFVVESYSGVLSPLKLKRSDYCLSPDAEVLDNASEVSSLGNHCEKDLECQKASRGQDSYWGQAYAHMNTLHEAVHVELDAEKPQF